MNKLQKIKVTTNTTKKGSIKVEAKPTKPKHIKIKAKTAKSERNAKIFKYLKLTLVIAQAIASIIFLISIFRLNIISPQALAILAVAFILIWALCFTKLILNKKTPKSTQIICALASIAIMVASVAAFRYTNSANSFLDNITDQSAETKEYSVLVLKTNGTSQIEQLQGSTINFLKTDIDSERAVAKLKETINFTAGYSPDFDNLAAVLLDQTVPAIVLETARLNALAEDEHNLHRASKVIYTFTIELETTTANAELDVTNTPFILYISGSDSRSGIKTTARSDVNILAVVNPKDHKILLVSIPRDTYVQLHNTTGLKDKLTHAGIYGINMSKTTIEDLLGININYTAKVGFDTVVDLVDQLDGIEINSDQAMTLKTGDGSANRNKTCTYVVGIQHVDGDCALRFARERKSYQSGDRHRGENQQQVLTAIINKLSTSSSYLLKLPQILDAISNSFETSFSRDDITSLIRQQMNNNQSWQVESISINGTGSMQPTYSMGANRPLYVMLPDQATIDTAKAKIDAYLK